MQDSFFVVFSKSGVDRWYKNPGFTLKPGEYAAVVRLFVPDEAFVRPNYPVVNIKVPEDALYRNVEITVEADEEEE